MPTKNRHGNRRSHGNKNARNRCRASQERTLPDSPATIEKAFENCWMNVSGKPGSATPPCGIGWRNVQTGIPGKLRRQEIYSPLAVFPIVQIHGKSGTASGKRTSITTGCPGFWYLSFRVPCCVPSCRGQAWAPFRAGPEYQSHSPLFSGMGPEHTALTEVPHSNSAPR